MASCCRKARFSKAKLHRPLSVALKKQHNKDSNSLIPMECRARPQKVNDINGYEVLAKDRLRDALHYDELEKIFDLLK